MVWLVGHKGMLGTEVARLLTEQDVAFVATDVDVDITSAQAVDDFVSAHVPDWIINCAAYTAVDQAEDDEERAYAINATGPANLARAAASTPELTRLVHVSTDYVFDGTAASPISEDTPTKPLGAYGRTKEAGERAVTAGCASHFVVRTAWLYGVHGKNFVSTMLRLMRERDELSVVSDQVGSPTYAVDLARAIVRFVVTDCRDYGFYHYTNAGETSWHGFARAIQEDAFARGLIDRRIPVRPIAAADYPAKAPRPAYSVLSTGRIREALAIDIADWRDGLARYFDQYQSETGGT
ncbi:MAG: dTDP-4-dehydrorhamnose reductase [Spirochaetota bacterium]